MRARYLLAVAFLWLSGFVVLAGALAQDATKPAAASGSDASHCATPPPAKDKEQGTSKPQTDCTTGGPSAAPKDAAKKPSTAEDNPFPEDISRKAQDETKSQTVPEAPAAAAPPAGAKSGGNSDYGDLGKPPDPVEPPRKELKLESPDGTAGDYDPKRAAEDVRVGRFYLQTGEYRGAYERLKDATVFDHENVEAIFWLAEAARKMKQLPEAEQNYLLYLSANPEGPNARAAKKALNEIASSHKP
jgi:tetratricopeptide (TPR) repeat protein